MRDQSAFIVDDFRGAWDRTALYPKGYGQAFNNCRFKDGTVYIREPIDQTISLTGLSLGSNPIKDWVPFRPSTAPFTPRYLVLTYQSGTNTGRVYDSGAAAPATPILTVTGMQGFAVQILFDRAYITPNDTAKGLSAEFVYVYDPALMTTARKAAGLKPATALTPAVGAAGNVAPGVHLISYAYETNTGFITKYATPATVTVPAGTPSIITLTGVANGPAGTTKKHLLMSKFITNYDGNPDHYELFFAGTINDNTTTTGNINLYDTQLVSSAVYLLDQLEEIPSGLGIGTFIGRLTVWNFFSLADGDLIRVSKRGEPESMAATDGYAIVGKGEGGRLNNAREYRGTLYGWKGRRTYNIQATDAPPSSWPVNTTDDNKGTNRKGVAEIVDASGASLDFLLIICLDGIYPFDGTYPDIPLTYAIEGSMRNQYSKNFGRHHIVADPVTKRIFVSFADDATTGYDLWSVDFSQGLAYDKVRWSRWIMNGVTMTGAVAMHVEPFSNAGQETSRLLFADSVVNSSLKGILLNEAVPTVGDTNFSGAAQDISWVFGLGSIGFEDGAICQFSAIDARGFLGSNCNLNFIFDYNQIDSITGLSTGTGNYLRRLINYVFERIRVVEFARTAQDYSDPQFGSNYCEQMIIHGKPIWQSRPL